MTCQLHCPFERLPTYVALTGAHRQVGTADMIGQRYGAAETGAAYVAENAVAALTIDLRFGTASLFRQTSTETADRSSYTCRLDTKNTVLPS
jgi:hypothetical protein